MIKDDHSSLASPRVATINAADPSIHEQLVRPWDLCQKVVEAGEFGYRMDYLLLDGLTLYRERYDLRCNLQGLSPPDTLVFTLPVVIGARSKFWGSACESSDMPSMLPGGLDLQLDRGQEQWVILVERKVLSASLSHEQITSLERAAYNRLLSSTYEQLQSFQKWLKSLMQLAVTFPDVLDEKMARISIRDDIINRLNQSLIENAIIRPAATFSKRKQGLNRALEFLRYADPVGLSIVELSQIANVSQRTLEYAFQDTFNMTPLAFIRMRRLHSARASLVKHSLGEKTVARIASEHGFYELGRFSVTYREYFGESPSQTLSRDISIPSIKLSL